MVPVLLKRLKYFKYFIGFAKQSKLWVIISLVHGDNIPSHSASFKWMQY